MKKKKREHTHLTLPMKQKENTKKNKSIEMIMRTIHRQNRLVGNIRE